MEALVTTDNINWQPFADNILLEKSNIYVFKVDIAKYYIQINGIYTQVLSTEEIAKSVRYLHKADQERYISTRYLLRKLLSKMGAGAAKDIKFHYLQYKKPSIAGIEFNISHSANYILLAFGPTPVGIDIELINTSFDFEPLLATSFSFNEIAFIKNGTNPPANFYTLWTRKEAILKASGEGLTEKLEQVACLHTPIEWKHTTYNLTSFNIDNTYVACLAVTSITDKIIYLSV